MFVRIGILCEEESFLFYNGRLEYLLVATIINNTLLLIHPVYLLNDEINFFYNINIFIEKLNNEQHCDQIVSEICYIPM